MYFINGKYLIIVMKSHGVWKTVWTLISWLLKKPADLDQFISGFTLFFKELKHVYCLSTARA